MGGEGIFPAEWVENIPAWLRIVMLVIAFPVVMVVAFLLFGYLSALLYSPLFLVRWLRRRRAQVEKHRLWNRVQRTLQISRHPGRCLRSSMCSWTSA